MIDLSKLPAPAIIEELDFESILAAMRADLAARLPGWTAAELESDPANKILEVAAYREMLMRQRVNEAARACMLAFAAGGDLEHLSAFYAVARLEGARATFPAELSLSAALPQDVTIPRGYAVADASGNAAELSRNVTIAAGRTAVVGVFEVTAPTGGAGNGLSSHWSATAPLPWLVKITQTAAASGGSDAESDDSLRARTQLSPESWSVAGPAGAYKYWALSADGRLADVHVFCPAPGTVQVTALSSEGDGTADEVMLGRIRAILDDEGVRPLSDSVVVRSALPLSYQIRAHLKIEAGASPAPVLAEARAALEKLAAAKHKINAELPRSAVIAAAHVEGVRKVALARPETDLSASADEAPYCSGIAVTWSIADE